MMWSFFARPPVRILTFTVHGIPKCPLKANAKFQQAAMEIRVVPLSDNSKATDKGHEPQDPVWEQLGEGQEKGRLVRRE